MNKKKIANILLIFFLLCSLFPIIPFSTVGDEPVIILIENGDTYELYGFDDLGIYYTPESLTLFHMPFILEKKGVFVNLDKYDLDGSYNDKHGKFDKRFISHSFNILDENADWWVIDFSMNVLASNESFSVDFSPTIKNVEFPQFAWWNSSWSIFRTITIDSSKIDTPLVNFPVLVAINDTIGDLCDGGDSIRFLNTGNTVEYYYEIEDWTDGLDRIVWVKIPYIYSSVDTSFSMYYNNSGASDNQSVTNVWDSNYVMVQHLNSTSGIDSTSNNYDMTVFGSSAVSGKIDGSQLFDVSADRITTNNVLPAMATFTIEQWANFSSAVAGNPDMLFVLPTNDPSMYRTPTESIGVYADGVLKLNSGCIADTNWHYFVVRANGTNLSLFIDGNNLQTVAYTGSSANSNFHLGDNGGATDTFYGTIDESRISNSTRNASWINATFHSQNQTTGFLTWGIEEHYVDPSMDVSAFFTNPTGWTYIYISWTKGINATHTMVRSSTTTYPPDITSGDLVYNGTASNVTDSSLAPHTLFYYSAWGFNDTTSYWSLNYNTSTNYTGPANPTSVSAAPVGSDLSITWVMGTHADATVVTRKIGSYPTGPTDGTALYNGSLLYLTALDVLPTYYFTLFSWDDVTDLHSSGAELEWGGMNISVFNESNPTQAVTNWDIVISNQDGTESYAAYNQNNILYLDINDLPTGVNTIIQIDADGYKQRIYYEDIVINQYYTIVAYLPPVETPGGDEGEGTLRTFTDSITVTNPAVDATITLTHELDEIISVEIYNSSLYVTYGGWIAVPNDKFTYTSTHVIVNSSVLDANTTMARATYYYMHYEGTIRAILCKVIVIDEMDQRISNATCFIKRINNATGNHINISIEVTDGYGEFNIWLLEDTLYSFHVTKSGFTQEGSRFWTPSTLIYTKTFKLSLELPVIPEYDVFWNIVTFKATVNANNTIYVTYCDSGESTINTTITVFNVTNITRALLDTDSRSGEDCFSYYIHGIDANETHVAILHFNNTATFDVSSPVTLTILPIFHGSTPFDLDDRVSNIVGPAWFGGWDWGVDVGWHNIFAVIIPLILLISFGVYNTGLGIFSCGLSLGLIQGIYAMWFTNTFNAGLVLLCPVVIVIAIIYMWTKGQGGDNL